MTTNIASDAAARGTGPRAETRGTSVLLRDLSRTFGATLALDGLSIEIAPAS